MRRGDGPPRAVRRDVAPRRAASVEPNDARSRMLQNVSCLVYCMNECKKEYVRVLCHVVILLLEIEQPVTLVSCTVCSIFTVW